jgi:hypothetical protein
MSDGDYVLGTRDEEVERLGLQHRVWRPRMLDGWRRAGFTVGQTILDVGAARASLRPIWLRSSASTDKS